MGSNNFWRRTFILKYYTCVMINHGLHIPFKSCFWWQMCVFKNFFHENSVLLYGKYSRAVCKQESRLQLDLVTMQWVINYILHIQIWIQPKLREYFREMKNYESKNMNAPSVNIFLRCVLGYCTFAVSCKSV